MGQFLTERLMVNKGFSIAFDMWRAEIEGRRMKPQWSATDRTKSNILNTGEETNITKRDLTNHVVVQGLVPCPAFFVLPNFLEFGKDFICTQFSTKYIYAQNHIKMTMSRHFIPRIMKPYFSWHWKNRTLQNMKINLVELTSMRIRGGIDGQSASCRSLKISWYFTSRT